MKRLLSIVFFYLLVCCCSNEMGVTPAYNPGWQPPIVEGLQLTNEFGEPINIWGTPSYNANNLVNGNSFRSRFLNSGKVYPNPSCGTITLKFGLPQSEKVKIWITPARWINNSKINYDMNNLLVTGEGGRAIDILANGSEEFSAGLHIFDWPRSNIQRKISSGFYRVYFKSQEKTIWIDFYLGCNRDKNPKGLEKYLN